MDDERIYFHKVLVSLVDGYVPSSSTFNRKYSEWMTKPILHKIRLKRKVWMKYKITQTDSDHDDLAYINVEMRLPKLYRRVNFVIKKS